MDKKMKKYFMNQREILVTMDNASTLSGYKDCKTVICDNDFTHVILLNVYTLQHRMYIILIPFNTPRSPIIGQVF
jgi:hypothetical protein